MKTKIKRHSRSVISVILAVCMLVSCMTVGIIATDAAKVTNSGAVGATVDSDSTVGAVPSRIYFKPGARWTEDGAKFGANFNKDGASYTYSMMTEVPGNSGVYYVAVPADKNKVQFTRLENGATEANTTNTWTWGANDNIPTDGYTNLFTRSTSGKGWETSGVWSVYDNDIAVPASLAFDPNPATASVSGTTRLSWTCTDDAKVDHYRIYKDGTILKDGDNNDLITNQLYYDFPALPSSAGEYTIKAVPSDTISYTTSDASTGVTLTVNKTALPAPEITVDTATANASQGSKSTISWSAVSNAGSYEVYKAGTAEKIATVNAPNTSYQVEQGYSYSGDYTVKAVPSDTATYTTSAASNSVTLTFNKVAINTKPTITVGGAGYDSTTQSANDDGVVTVTVTNAASFKDACDFSLSGSTATFSENVFTITSFTNKSQSGSDNSLTVTPSLKAGMDDYYTLTAIASDAATVKVYTPGYFLVGNIDTSHMVEGIGSETKWTLNSTERTGTYAPLKIDNATSKPGVYTFTIHTKDTGTTNNVNIGLFDTAQVGFVRTDEGITAAEKYLNKIGRDYVIPEAGTANLYAGKGDGGAGSLILQPNKKYTITIDQTAAVYEDNWNDRNGHITITVDTWNVDTAAYYQDYNLANGSYLAITKGDTGGTATNAGTPAGDLEYTAYLKKDSQVTLTATKEAGYDFLGWYNNTDFEDEHKIISAGASGVINTGNQYTYTFTPDADGPYYAFFKKPEPAKRKINVDTVDNATVTATWNGVTAQEGGSLKNVPEGATVAVTIVADDGYQMTAITPAITTDSAAAFDGFTYTGNYTVGNANATIKPTIAEYSQHKVKVGALHESTVRNFTVTYTKNTLPQEVTFTGTRELTVDNATDVAITANVTSTLSTINGWNDGTSTDTTNTETTITLSDVAADTTRLLDVTKPTDCIYIWNTANANDIYVYFYNQDNSALSGSAAWGGTPIRVNGAYNTSAGRYDATSNIFILNKYLTSTTGEYADLSSINGCAMKINNTGTDSNSQSGKMTLTIGNTYEVKTNTGTWSIPNGNIGDPTGTTVLKVQKACENNSAKTVQGLHVWSYKSGNKVIMDGGSNKDNLTDNTYNAGTSIKETSDATYYTVTIPNTKFLDNTDSGKFWAMMFTNHDSYQTTNSGDMEIGHSYILKAHWNGSDGYYVDVVSDDGGSVTAYYVVGMLDDGTEGIFDNVWADGSNEFSGTDMLTEVAGSPGIFKKEYTEGLVVSGLHSYKIVKVTIDGTGEVHEEWYPSGDNRTLNIPDGATKAWFQIDTTNSNAVTAGTEGGSAGGDDTGEWTQTVMKYSTNTHTAAAVPTPGNDSSSHYFIYCTSGNSFENNIRAKYAVVDESNNGYWAEITDLLVNNSVSIGLTADGTEKTNLIAADANNKVNGGQHVNTDNSQQDYTLNIYESDGTTLVCQTQLKEIDTKGYLYVFNVGEGYKIALRATVDGSTVDYNIYYKKVAPEPPAPVTKVNIYAKNGELRDSTFNRFTKLADTDIVSVTVDGVEYTPTSAELWPDGTWSNDETKYSSTYAKLTNVPVGSVIKLRTYLSGNTADTLNYQTNKAFKDTHYLKAYTMNGKTYQIHSASEAKTDAYKINANDEYYEEDWTVEAINTDNMQDSSGNKVVEITPIYYLKDNTFTKTFYIDGYVGDLQTNWGTLLSVYPYYEGKSNKDNAFGGYPGQPMLFWGGKYQMEVPLTVDGSSKGAQVKGITMHNSYWDLLHRSLDKKCDDSHRQTYDYDDFYKLYKEKDPDSIIFWFKYTDQEDHYNDGFDYTNYTFAGTDPKQASDFVGEGKNGVEIVTDYYGRQVDVFGTLLTDSQKSDYDTDHVQSNELLLVSTGYKDTYVGEYATIWAVYAPVSDMKGSDTSKKFIGYISSSMLYLNSFDRVGQYTDGTNTAKGRMSWSEFKKTYDYLKKYYQGVPALISYEKEIWNDSKDKANRSDGKWFYSTGKEKINANILIQYTTNNSAGISDVTEVASTGWKTDTFSTRKTGAGGEQNVGEITSCSAYFTNKTPQYLFGKTEANGVLVDNSDYFDFKAESGGTWQFAGWVRYSGGEYNEIASIDGVGQSNISSNDTYIARFVKAKAGSLVISHNTEQTKDYTGTGTKYLKVEELDESQHSLATPVYFENSDGKDIDVSDYMLSTNKNKYIKITLTTVPDVDCTVAKRSASPANYNPDQTEGFSSGTVTQTITLKVGDILAAGTTAIRYKTYLSKTPITYNYSITYHYTSRFWGVQTYNVSGKIDELRAETDLEGKKGDAKLSMTFLKQKQPYEQNFRQSIKWNYTENAVGSADPVSRTNTAGGANVYNLTANVYSSNVIDNTVKAEFILPYKYYTDSEAVKDGNAVSGYSDKHAVELDFYAAADSESPSGTKGVAFDDKNYETFTLTSEYGNLFQYSNIKAHGNGGTTDSYQLVEAAPYVLKKSDGSYVDFHTHKESQKRYHTGDSFTVKKKLTEGSDVLTEVTYYKDINDVPDKYKDGDAISTDYTNTQVVLDGDNSVDVVKPEKKDTPGYEKTTYYYAVQDDETGDVYFFAYVMNENDEMVTNAGAATNTPVFNGQYIIYSEPDKIDGIIGTPETYTRHDFKRWDIFSTKGTYIASTYARKFNYSGYENYIVKPVYDDSEAGTSVIGSDNVATTLTYLGDSRNQWKAANEDDTAAKGNYTKGTLSGDKLFTDFAISYQYKDRLTEVAGDTAKIQTGLVIEKLDPAETSGGSIITDMSYYAQNSDYNTYSAEEVIAYVKGKIDGPSASRPNMAVSNGATFVTIGKNFGDGANNFKGTPAFGNDELTTTTTMVDNMNRMRYYYTFTQSENGVNPAGNTRTVNMVYRVTSYIYVQEGDGDAQVALSAPVYLTLAELASR